jgi:hypothetical protein
LLAFAFSSTGFPFKIFWNDFRLPGQYSTPMSLPPTGSSKGGGRFCAAFPFFLSYKQWLAPELSRHFSKEIAPPGNAETPGVGRESTEPTWLWTPGIRWHIL